MQRQFSIPQRKEGGHWQDLDLVRQELQPFLHPVTPQPHNCNCSAEKTSPLQHRAGRPKKKSNKCAANGSSHQPEGKTPQAKACHRQNGSSTATANVQGTQHNNQPSNGQVETDVAVTQLTTNGIEITQGPHGQPGSNGAVAAVIGGADKGGSRMEYRMPTQLELIAAGRMDLLNAMRVWGGFTAVADLMGILPNTRYTTSTSTYQPHAHLILIHSSLSYSHLANLGHSKNLIQKLLIRMGRATSSSALCELCEPRKNSEKYSCWGMRV